MKKSVKAVVLATACLIFAIVACGCSQGTSSASDFKGQTIMCQVTNVDGNIVTATVGGPSMGGGMPGGDSANGEPPAKPDGDTSGSEPPAKPEGESGDQAQSSDQTQGQDQNQDQSQNGQQQPPEMPSGDQGGQQPPEMPSGDQGGQGPEGNAQGGPGGTGGQDQSSSSDSQVVVLDLTGVSVTKQSMSEPSQSGAADENADAVDVESKANASEDSDESDKTAANTDGDNGEAAIVGENAASSTAEASIEDITEGTMLSVTVDESGAITSVVIGGAGGPGAGGTGGAGAGGGFGGSGTVNQGTAANTIDEDGTYEGGEYESTGDDENALRVTDGATATLTGATVDKSAGSSSNTEDGDFYGMNAALLATDGANVTIKGASVSSNVKNGNGIFSYGQGTVVTVEDTTIKTSGDSSGGIQTTGGATTNAKNLTIETKGGSSAAIRSDRGGGTVNVDGGSYATSGVGSPAVYSTATISVKDATLSAANSEALVIEGKNSISLEDCEVSGNMTSSAGGSGENLHNVMVYQSMSGDAEEGTSSLSIKGGSLVGESGDMFYVTNTKAKIALSGVDISNKATADENGDSVRLLEVAGNGSSRGWGTAGANGGQLEFTATDQELEGDIVVDSISTLAFTMADGSTLTGTINVVDNEQGGTAVDDNAVVTIGAGCTWTLTGDCKITSLDNKGTINFNGHTITLADGTVLR